MATNILQQTSFTDNFNYLKPTNFSIKIDNKRFRNLQFFANTVSHPGVSVQAPTIAIPRLQNLAVPGDTYTVDELSMDILLDEDMACYIEMYNWLNTTVQHNYESQIDRLGDGYIPETDIIVSILSSHNNTVKKIKYVDCVPTSIGALTLQSSLADDSPITFPITFRTSYFEIL